MSYKKIILKKGKERSLQRFHLWVFSGAIAREEGQARNGEIVEVYDAWENYLATGHYQKGSITVRILSFEQEEIGPDFWEKRIREAIDTRKSLGLWDDPKTNIFRLIHGEGDGLPGLILDYFDGNIVMQAHSRGMYKGRREIAQAIASVMGEDLKCIYCKSSDTLHDKSEQVENEYLYGEGKENGSTFLEHGLKFSVNWETGQKTGFFNDQRDNRKLLGSFSKGKSVLNTFCYSGGFSIAALSEGARKVVSVDSSVKAIELVKENVSINGFDEKKHEAIAADTMAFLKQNEEDFDIVILDPPAYAKHREAKHRAVQAYKRLNAQAMKYIKPGGLLFTFSCSQVVDKSLFNHTITAAAIESGRKVKVLHQLHQPGDHPVNIFHPEGEYLKGLVLEIV